jgi:tetratricopeptide (TPR) repeat protein
MTRKTLLTVAYGLLALLLFLLFLELKRRHEWPSSALFIAALFFLLPGRIVGYYWRDLIRGRRYLNQRDYSLSIAHSKTFLAQLRHKPWIKHLIWIAPSLWTISVQAMAYNNLGAALLESGDLSQAQSAFLKALDCDRQYPMPQYNLAVIATLQQNLVSAREHFELSKRLGFAHNTFDRFLDTVKTLYARFEPMA